MPACDARGAGAPEASPGAPAASAIAFGAAVAAGTLLSSGAFVALAAFTFVAAGCCVIEAAIDADALGTVSTFVGALPVVELLPLDAVGGVVAGAGFTLLLATSAGSPSKPFRAGMRSRNAYAPAPKPSSRIAAIAHGNAERRGCVGTAVARSSTD